MSFILPQQVIWRHLAHVPETSLETIGFVHRPSIVMEHDEDDEDAEQRPNKKRKDEVEANLKFNEEESPPQVAGDGLYSVINNEIREHVRAVVSEIGMRERGKDVQFAVDERLANLPINYLVAIEGHLLGASSILSTTKFNSLVERGVAGLNGNYEMALARCNESRYLRLMIEGDYIAVEENAKPSNILGGAQEDALPDVTSDSKPGHPVASIIPKASPHSIVCDFEGRKFRLDGSQVVLQRTKYSKRNLKGSLAIGNERRKRLRGNTMLLVVQHMLRFMGADNHLAGTDSGLLLGGYKPIARYFEGGRKSFPFLKLDIAPVNIETMFARTAFALQSNLANRLNRCKLTGDGQTLELLGQSCMAWRQDVDLGMNLCKKSVVCDQRMGDSSRSSTLYDIDKPNTATRFGLAKDHMNSATNRVFHDSLCEFFQSQGAGTRFHNQYMVGKGAVEVRTHKIGNASPEENPVEDSNNTSIDSDKEQSDTTAATCEEAAVWMIKDPITATLQEEIIREVNKLSFIASSQEVGSNTKVKSRYYRMATNCDKGGLFQLSSDPRLIECERMDAIERKLVDLVSSLMEEQDRVVSEANPGKKMCRWVHSKTMCQVTVGTTKDSTYGKHTDCGLHHNHEMGEAHSADSDMEREMLKRLPPDSLMRVATLVLSTCDGTNAKLQFTEPGSDKVVMSLETTNNCLHIQGYGCQRYLRHQVVPVAVSSDLNLEEQGTKNGVRLVFSFRYSIDKDDDDLISAILEGDGRLKQGNTRGDYTATGVVDAIEKGCRPHVRGKSDNDPVHAPCPPPDGGLGLFDPTLELLNQCGGGDKPKRLVQDSIPCDQASVRQSTENDKSTFKDKQQLWTRVTSSAFLKALNRKKIRVQLHHTIPPKKKEATKVGRKVQVCVGRAPRLHVVTNYGHGDPMEALKVLEVGDVLAENTVREHYGIPCNEHTSPPWSCVHEAMLNCIIVAQDYKNDYASIRRIQEQIQAGIYNPNEEDDLFWVGGSGGAPEDYGNRPIDLSQIAMREKMARYVLPHTQSPKSAMNECLLSLVGRQGMVALFAHPLDATSVTGRDEKKLQFLGHYTATGSTTGNNWTDKKIVEFATNLPGKGHDKARVKSALWLKADGCIRATFRFAGIDSTSTPENTPAATSDCQTDGGGGGDRKPKATQLPPFEEAVTTNDHAGTCDDRPSEDECSLSSGESDDWQLGKLDLDGEIAKVNLGYTSSKGHLTNDAVLDDPDDPFGLILEVADTTSMAGKFIKEGHFGLLFQDTPEEKKRPLAEKLTVSSYSMFSFLARLSVGASYRLTRSHLVDGHRDGIERAGYLLPERDQKFRHLGRVVQRTPSPFPIRTYDLGTQFQRECANSSHPLLFGHDQSTGDYGMPALSELHRNVVKDLLLTTLIVRTTGRVEHLREYLEYTEQHAAENNRGWKRLFQSSDCRLLPLYISSSSAKRDATEAYVQKESMSPWLSEQFKESLPFAIRASPKSYSEYLANVEGELDDFVELIKSEDHRDREAVVKRLSSILHAASTVGKQENRANCMFMSHQMIADLEEVVSGPAGRGTSPFTGDYVWAGYGGKQGYIALDHSVLMERDCSGPGYKRWHNDHSPKLLIEACQKLRGNLENEVDDVHLSLMGLRKTGNKVRVRLTGRRLGLNDVEHMLCKVYLSCTRARGSRAHGTSRAWRNFCWPPKRQDTVCSTHLKDTINQFIINRYESAILEPSETGCGGLHVLGHPFSDL